MRAIVIVLLSPLFDNRLGFSPIGEEPAIETLRSKCAVETLDKRIFPRATRLDGKRVATVVTQPRLESNGNEFRAIVTAQIAWCAMHEKQPCQNLDHLL